MNRKSILLLSILATFGIEKAQAKAQTKAQADTFSCPQPNKFKYKYNHNQLETTMRILGTKQTMVIQSTDSPDVTPLWAYDTTYIYALKSATVSRGPFFKIYCKYNVLVANARKSLKDCEKIKGACKMVSATGTIVIRKPYKSCKVQKDNSVICLERQTSRP